jgi:hypothetical protein
LLDGGGIAMRSRLYGENSLLDLVKAINRRGGNVEFIFNTSGAEIRVMKKGTPSGGLPKYSVTGTSLKDAVVKGARDKGLFDFLSPPNEKSPRKAPKPAA